MAKKSGRLLRFVAAMLATVFLASPFQVFSASRLDGDSKSTSSSTSKTTGKSTGKSSVYSFTKIKAAINKSKEINSDVKGWLIVPGTDINDPIVLSTESNRYYLYRDLNKVDYPKLNYKNYVDTANYLDYRTKLGKTWNSSSRNISIYGHNWTNLREPVDVGPNPNHRMFAQLASYSDIKFAQANPHIYFSTGENEGIWRVFCVAYVEESNPNLDYGGPNPSDEKYVKLIKEYLARSKFDFGVEIKKSDRILTLSTCTRQYNNGDKQKFIVVARLLRDGESENDTIKVTVNKDMKKPKLTPYK